ncbi:hypothetical protein [Solirubrum puertoriconensis]|uniref:Uncharacterized protein n=1 Tax=Solirubrum puertoriconensis TaxID=1751427 RepID=A0A9X0HHV3_SOLP1|nr:hypothetical protein [Solirubrum puertoriconensis]KUG06107.1 hypothetical protein ASU33_01700 [Solirubrum puertoriconensis]
MQRLTKTLFAALLLLGSASAFTEANAQVTININPPSWGPAVPAGKQYYYVPEYGGYYDVREQNYIVQRSGKWTRLRSLNGYNPANFHPVVINYVGATPWVQVTEHRAKYGHPHGMPPGQAKKMRGYSSQPGVIVNVPGGGGYGGPGNGNGKHGGGHPGKGHGKGKH